MHSICNILQYMYIIIISLLTVQQNDRSRSKSTSSILGRLGSFKKTRREDDSKVFTVQFLGCQQVAKPEGLEVVKGPIQVHPYIEYSSIPHRLPHNKAHQRHSLVK